MADKDNNSKNLPNRRKFLYQMLAGAAAVGTGAALLPKLLRDPNALTTQDAAQIYKDLETAIHKQAAEAKRNHAPFCVLVGEDHTDELSKVYDLMVMDICKNMGLKNFYYEATPEDYAKMSTYFKQYDYNVDKLLDANSNLPENNVLQAYDTMQLVRHAQKSGYTDYFVDGPSDVVNDMSRQSATNAVVGSEEEARKIGKLFDATMDIRSDYIASQIAKHKDGGVSVGGILHLKEVSTQLKSKGFSVLTIRSADAAAEMDTPKTQEALAWAKDPHNAMQPTAKYYSREADEEMDDFETIKAFADKAIALAKSPAMKRINTGQTGSDRTL